MASRGYKKYMKQDVRQGHPLVKIFIISFFGMLLLCTFIINSLAKKMTVDTSIGDYKEQATEELESKNIVDNRLTMIQNEDQERSFKDLMQSSDDSSKEKEPTEVQTNVQQSVPENTLNTTTPAQDTVYKVYIGSYSSAEQAKVAKEIIQESGSGLNPIVKCIGSNNYTLQVGIFKNKQSAEAMLVSVQKVNLPGRIVQEN